MDITVSFALAVGVVSLALIAAVLSNQLSRWIRIPAPALFLLVASVAGTLFPALGEVPRKLDEEIVSVALIFILFDGGMRIGFRRLRASWGSITWLGVAGTVVTAGGLAIAAHLLLGFSWQASLLLGAALAPTDPAVVFSVLGKREIGGRTGTILEGESGANDPVGIALMTSLLAAAGTGLDALGTGVVEFLLQMFVGAAVGILLGWLLGAVLKRISLVNESLHSILTLGCAALVYAIASILEGSGFLAVFLAGILIGDVRAPFKREVERFSSSIAGIAEIVAFVVLGLSISIPRILSPDVLLPGLLIAGLLIFVIRPVLVGALTVPLKLRLGEKAFLLWAGLKGAVPILLGLFVLGARVPRAQQLFGIIVIVVLVSVLLQGSLVPAAARFFRVPMRVAQPEPFVIGMRLTEQPDGVHTFVVQPQSIADGCEVGELPLGSDGWVSVVRRNGRLLQVRSKLKLRDGDEVLALADDVGVGDRIFTQQAD